MLSLIGFQSQAQITVFPHTEDFESFTTCTGSCNSPCALGNGWSNEQSGGDGGEWITDVGGTSSSSTGPSVDYNPGTSTGKYIYFETSSPCYSNVTAIMYTPALDLTGVGGMSMIFGYHMYGSSMGSLNVDASTDGGATWSTLWTQNGDQGNQWLRDTLDLNAYAGGFVTLRFRGVSATSFTSDMAIDDITFYEPLQNDAGITAIPSPGLPSCNLTNANVTGTLQNFGFDTLTSVTIGWAVNAVPQTPLNWTGSLAPGSFMNESLGTYSFVDGDVLEVWTEMPNGVSETGSGPGNDTTTIVIQTGLSGNYTIGATGDYIDFTSAVAALNLYGVCGPVIFDVEDGVYNEQVVINAIGGASSTNTITFRGLNADPTLANLQFAATGTGDNFVVQMDGASYITFQDLTLQSLGLTYGTVINALNGASFNTWDGNIIMGDANVSTTSTNMALITSFNGTLDSMNVFTNNEMAYGSYSMYWYGNNTTGLENGVEISNNNLHDFYYRGLHLYYMENTIVSNNILEPGSTYTGSIYRIYMYYNNGDVRVDNNEIRGMNYGYGWYMSNCTAPALNRGRIYNNFVHVGDTSNTSTSYGGYFTTVSNFDIANNSFNVTSNGTASRAVYMTGGTGNDVYNNNIVNDGPGYGFYLLGGSNWIDYNNYYVPNGNVGYFGSDQTTLTDWQNVTGFDANGVSGDPGYAGYDDLHTCNDSLLDGAGWVDSLITMDIDGQTRNLAAFDIGADEFLGLANFGFTTDSIWKCSADVLTLGGWDPVDDATYLWSTTETTPTIDVLIEGAYSVTASTVCGSNISSVEVVNIPDAVAGFDITTSFLTGIFTSTSAGTIDSYSWDFGDGGSSTMEDPIHVYAAPGNYVVTLTVTGPCGTDVIVDTMVASTVGIDETLLSEGLTVSPNPNTGDFTIDLDIQSANNVNAAILSTEGRVIWNEDLGSVNGSMSKEVSLTNVPAGIYFVRITADDQTAVRRLMIK